MLISKSIVKIRLPIQLPEEVISFYLKNEHFKGDDPAVKTNYLEYFTYFLVSAKTCKNSSKLKSNKNKIYELFTIGTCDKRRNIRLCPQTA